MVSNRLIFFFLIPLFLAWVFCVAALLFNTDYYFSMLGFLCLVALSPAMVLKGSLDVFEPLVLVYLATFLGGTARAVLLSSDGANNYPFIMQGYNLEIIFPYGFLILIGLFSFSLGYLITSRRFYLLKIFPRLSGEFNSSRLKFVFVFCLFVSLIGTYLFSSAMNVDFSNINAISNKRAILVGNGENYTAHGYFKLLSAFSEYALYIFVAYACWSEKKTTARMFFVMFLLFFAACLTPFISSSRMDIILMMINVAILLYYAHRRKIPKRLLLFFVITSFVLASIMGFLRATAQGKDAVVENPIIAVIASGNFVDIVRFSVVVNEVPDKLDFMYGESLVSWVFSPVPRSFWPEKPALSLGPIIRSDIYGLPTRNNGFPPGIITEGYMNFGYLGIFFLPLFFGILLRYLYNSFSKYLSKYPHVVILYIGFVWRFSFGAIGLNFSQALVQVLTDVLVLYFLIIYVGRNRKA